MKSSVTSIDLQKFMEFNSISTISDLLLLPNEDFYVMVGFTYHILTEILEIKQTFSIQNTTN